LNQLFIVISIRLGFRKENVAANRIKESHHLYQERWDNIIMPDYCVGLKNVPTK